MPLTQADVHNVAFNKPPIGKRGYNEDEVDQFLDLVEDTLGALYDENEDLRKQVAAGGGSAAPAVDEAAVTRRVEEKLRAEYDAKFADYKKSVDAKAAAAQSAPSASKGDDVATAKLEAELKATKQQLEAARKDAEAARAEATAAKQAAQDAKASASANSSQPAKLVGGEGEPATAETHMQAARVLSLAQEMADRLTSDAHSESQALKDKARAEAEKVVSEANASSQQTLANAQRESESKLADAKRRSEAMLSDATSKSAAQLKAAEDKANALQADAERKHTEIMATVKKQQSALEARIQELRTFEREYRTRLKTYLESQLEELATRGTAAPNDGNN